MNSSADLPIDRSLRRQGINIKKARLRRGLTREDFAEQMGVSASTLRRVEKGEQGVALHTLVRCFKVLGVLGVLDAFNSLLDTDRDAIGLVVQDACLPKRGHKLSAGGTT